MRISSTIETTQAEVAAALAQRQADEAEVLANAASILLGETILDVPGVYDAAGAIAAAEQAGKDAQLADDQAAVLADAAKIRAGQSVLNQAGTYKQSIYVPYYDNYGDLMYVTASSVYYDRCDFLIALYDCQIDYLSVTFDDYGSSLSYYFGITQNSTNVVSSAYLTFYQWYTNILNVDLSACGMTNCAVYFYCGSGADFVLNLANNAIPLGTDYDYGYDGTVSGIINECYNQAYLSQGLSYSSVNLTGYDMGNVEEGSDVHTNAEALNSAGWTVLYELALLP